MTVWVFFSRCWRSWPWTLEADELSLPKKIHVHEFVPFSKGDRPKKVGNTSEPTNPLKNQGDVETSFQGSTPLGWCQFPNLAKHLIFPWWIFSARCQYRTFSCSLRRAFSRSAQRCSRFSRLGFSRSFLEQKKGRYVMCGCKSKSS